MGGAGTGAWARWRPGVLEMSGRVGESGLGQHQRDSVVGNRKI